MNIKYIIGVNMSNTLYILRGIPGSGKSTLVKKLTPYYIETDDYFINSNGEYIFEHEKIPNSHAWALTQLETLMLNKYEYIAILDAFIHLETMEPYKKLARYYNYNVIELLVKSNFTNIHNIDYKRIQQICKEFEFTPYKDSHIKRNKLKDTYKAATINELEKICTCLEWECPMINTLECPFLSLSCNDVTNNMWKNYLGE